MQPQHSASLVLLPVMVAVLVAFLIIGLALPVLPLHVKNTLGYGTLTIGLVAGAQFATSLLSRIWAGSFSDRYGAKRCVISGLVIASASGFLYLISLFFIARPVVSVGILLLGRALLGAAESFIITGSVSWGLGMVDRDYAGRVIAWTGTAMFAAMAFGGPFGSLLFVSYGFVSIALVTILLPVLTLAFLIRFKPVPPSPRTVQTSLKTILKQVWMPGVGAAFSSIGYCSILAFSSLFYAEQFWQPVWLAFTAFGAALITARLVAGQLPDRFGGAKTALIFVLVQVAGLLMMCFARNVMVASAGAAIAGFGYSLVYPGFGVEVVRDTRPENRGLALGVYTAFLDVAMAAGSPVLGGIAGLAGLNAVFLASAIIVSCAALIAVRLLRRSSSAAR